MDRVILFKIINGEFHTLNPTMDAVEHCLRKGWALGSDASEDYAHWLNEREER
jgi:uncharacterized cupin superfamily protein